MIGVRCAWEVTAGLVPGEPDRQYGRRYEISAVEWAAKDARHRLFAERSGAAHGWAAHLSAAAANGAGVNWVHVGFVWY